MAHEHGEHGHGHGEHGHQHGTGHDHRHHHDGPRPVLPGDRERIDALWPFVKEQIPPGPGAVVEIGCGPLGGFVPLLHAKGHHTVGVDPSAPDGPSYRQVRFEDWQPGVGDVPVQAVVACLSLHHVDDIDALLARVAELMQPGGRLVVREWARERFDEATARWSFERLGPQAASEDEEPKRGYWLARHRDGWQEAGGDWSSYIEGWADDAGLLTGKALLHALEASPFETELLEFDPYFHLALEGVTVEQEQAAIDAGTIRANGIRYVGRLA
ncbi:class I SAM-dependent methyltransferase [Streptacidiphilus fuscans]|uniref:Methyltransferase domain-containing protein n=1 Tax=Streptacidiphilus fuscans TaxID=2789292 RepID=A0A931BAM6_9ACTN|nr:methyltransferase domain-containing protein [Streptacidiphilus fuscans]MBF9073106.1 methyltransferase domain-containing protein [Streptacidiphilus fuscans]